MIPFLAPVLLKLSPLGRLLKMIPRRVWLALLIVAAVVLLVWLGLRWHDGKVKELQETAYAEGRADALAEVNEQHERLLAKAVDLKVNAERAAAAINDHVRTDHAQETGAIRARADDLRLRGPGAARCEPDPAGGGMSRVSGGADPRPGADGPGVGPASVPQPDGLVGVPWEWLVGLAERHDSRGAALEAWEDWYARHLAAWEEWKRASQEP